MINILFSFFVYYIVKGGFIIEYYGEAFVKWIQKLLNELGFTLEVDGINGMKTKQAIKEFQLDEGLRVDGLVGQNTLHRILIRCGVDEQEAFINSQQLKSKTDFLIWVNSDTHKVNIFKGEAFEWKLIKSNLATLGKEETPTIKGKYQVGAKGLGYGGPYYGFKVKWYTQIHNNYLFHSILFNLDGTVQDGRLGLNLSDGCVRLKEEAAKYIYDHIPYGTLILIT